MGRKSEAEVAVRQNDVKEMLLQGKSTTHIIAYCMSEYSIGRSTVERDITIVYKELRQYFERAKEDIISEHIARYDKIFEQCMELINYRDALKALRQKEELLKYHRQEPLIAIQNNTMNVDNISDEVLLESIKKLSELNGKTN